MPCQFQGEIWQPLGCHRLWAWEQLQQERITWWKTCSSTLLQSFTQLECNILISFLLRFIKSTSACSKAQTEIKRVHMTSVLGKERNRIWKTVAFLVKQSPYSLFMKLRFYLSYLGKHLTEQELVTSGRQGHINQASSARTDELLLPLLCTSGKKLINI